MHALHAWFSWVQSSPDTLILYIYICYIEQQKVHDTYKGLNWIWTLNLRTEFYLIISNQNLVVQSMLLDLKLDINFYIYWWEIDAERQTKFWLGTSPNISMEGGEEEGLGWLVFNWSDRWWIIGREKVTLELPTVEKAWCFGHDSASSVHHADRDDDDDYFQAVV